MTEYARTERRLLADLLQSSGPDEPTVCAGWTTRDLAAHVVVRDRRPDASLGVVVAPLAGHGEHVRRQAAARPWPELLQDLRTPPWWSPLSNPLLDEVVNLGEFFIHHEDVRRTGSGWSPRVIGHGQQGALWKQVRFSARALLRKLPGATRVEAPGFGVLQVGDGDPAATLVGEPGELTLFISGRQRVARVEVTGDQSITTARLAL